MGVRAVHLKYMGRVKVSKKLMENANYGEVARISKVLHQSKHLAKLYFPMEMFLYSCRKKQTKKT